MKLFRRHRSAKENAAPKPGGRETPSEAPKRYLYAGREMTSADYARQERLYPPQPRPKPGGREGR